MASADVADTATKPKPIVEWVFKCLIIAFTGAFAWQQSTLTGEIAAARKERGDDKIAREKYDTDVRQERERLIDLALHISKQTDEAKSEAAAAKTAATALKSDVAAVKKVTEQTKAVTEQTKKAISELEQ